MKAGNFGMQAVDVQYVGSGSRQTRQHSGQLLFVRKSVGVLLDRAPGNGSND